MYGVMVPALVKESSSPDVFLAYGDTKFHIVSPDQMTAFGLRWDAVESVPDGSLDGLTRVEMCAGPQVKPSQVFPVDVVDPHVPGQTLKSSNVANNVLVAGFLTSPAAWNEKFDTGIEDLLYYLVLDTVFIDAMYGPAGLSTLLRKAPLPGHLDPGQGQISPGLPFGDLPEDANGDSCATVGSFVLPATNPDSAYKVAGGLGFPTLHMELNCWHVYETVGTVRDFFPPIPYHTQALGPAPAGWIHSPATNYPDCWWPFDPYNPDGGSHALRQYDNVLVCGTLYEDTAHDASGTAGDAAAWNDEFPGDGGWLEIHPIDWMWRYQPPPPTRTAYTVGLSSAPLASRNSSSGVMLPLTWNGVPVTPAQIAAGPVREVVDLRFSKGEQFTAHTIDVDASDHQPHIDLALDTTSGPRYFKATYIVDWTLEAGGGGDSSAVFVSQTVPAIITTPNATVNVTFRNSGPTTWTQAAGYHLGSQDPTDNAVWGTNRIELPGQVGPGDQVTFTFQIPAPPAAGAMFQWQMIQDGSGPFGTPSPAVLIGGQCAGLAAKITGQKNVILNLQKSLTQPGGNKVAILQQIADAEQLLGEYEQSQKTLGCPGAA